MEDIDIKFGVFVSVLSEAITYRYVQELKKRLENAFRKANAFWKEAIRSKQHFDRTARCSKLLPGNLVLVKKKGFTSKHKIADRWETEPYEIVSKRSDGLPVYTVTRNDRERTLHHNMLFPLGIRHKIEGILDDISESENSGNPVLVQVDNFPVSDGGVDQPVYEGPQTWSHSRKLMKANILMDQMFEIDQLPIPEVVDNPESLRDLILKF